MKTLNAFRGCLLGLALGDAFCADKEGGAIERCLWKLLGKTHEGKKRYTDDTQMMLDLASHLLRNNDIDQDALAREFAQSYAWSRGYGPSTAYVLKQIRRGMDWRIAVRRRYPNGSFGNGAAMRAPVAGLTGKTIDDIVDCVQKASEVTHPNPSAIAGARLIAIAVHYALNAIDIAEQWQETENSVCDAIIVQKMKTVVRLLRDNTLLCPADLKKSLGFGTAAADSCPTSVYLALAFINDHFENLIAYINQCSGDTDTIGAMAGAIWGTVNGYDRLPAALLNNLEKSDGILDIANALFHKYS